MSDPIHEDTRQQKSQNSKLLHNSVCMEQNVAAKIDGRHHKFQNLSWCEGGSIKNDNTENINYLIDNNFEDINNKISPEKPNATIQQHRMSNVLSIGSNGSHFDNAYHENKMFQDNNNANKNELYNNSCIASSMKNINNNTLNESNNNCNRFKNVFNGILQSLEKLELENKGIIINNTNNNLTKSKFNNGADDGVHIGSSNDIKSTSNNNSQKTTGNKYFCKDSMNNCNIANDKYIKHNNIKQTRKRKKWKYKYKAQLLPSINEGNEIEYFYIDTKLIFANGFNINNGSSKTSIDTNNNTSSGGIQLRPVNDGKSRCKLVLKSTDLIRMRQNFPVNTSYASDNTSLLAYAPGKNCQLFAKFGDSICVEQTKNNSVSNFDEIVQGDQKFLNNRLRSYSDINGNHMSFDDSMQHDQLKMQSWQYDIFSTIVDIGNTEANNFCIGGNSDVNNLNENATGSNTFFDTNQNSINCNRAELDGSSPNYSIDVCKHQRKENQSQDLRKLTYSNNSQLTDSTCVNYSTNNLIFNMDLVRKPCVFVLNYIDKIRQNIQAADLFGNSSNNNNCNNIDVHFKFIKISNYDQCLNVCDENLKFKSDGIDNKMIHIGRDVLDGVKGY